MAVPQLYEPAPLFTGFTARNPRFNLATLGGRPVVISFLGSVQHPLGRQLADGLADLVARLPAGEAVVGAVSADPRDRKDPGLREHMRLRPAFVLFHDDDLSIGKLWGLIPPETAVGQKLAFRPVTFVLDPRLRVFGTVTGVPGAEHLPRVLELLRAIPRTAAPAPVLVVPRVFEPELCRALIDYFEASGGQPSGSMRDHGGGTHRVLDPGVKRRQDVAVLEPRLREACRQRLLRRLAPEILKAFQFEASEIERDIVVRYDASEGGFFRPHRDNVSGSTTHRRFAATINLNAEDYSGGDLRFPEFGHYSYRAETGGAIVFSCSLLHEALPVTRGRRYAYLPFFFSQREAALFRQNVAAADRRLRTPDGKLLEGKPG